MRRTTYVVADSLAHRRVRDAITREGALGAGVVTLAGLATRLSGGFAQPVSSRELKSVLQAPPIDEASSLAGIATLPGFARAAANTLRAAWNAGLDLSANASAPGAHSRWAELAALERHVDQATGPGTWLPTRIASAALQRVERAQALVGDVVLERLADVPPLYRPLLEALTAHVKVTWRLPGGLTPDWRPSAVELEAAERHTPTIAIESCADPTHEALEALRWVRHLLVSGVPADQIAIAAVDVSAYDAALHSLASQSGLRVHFGHGSPLTTTASGQFAAALADALHNGADQWRVRRLIGAATTAGDPVLGALPPDWSEGISPDAALGTPAHWRRALERSGRSPHLTDLLMRLVLDLALGPAAAASVGQRWLSGTAALSWQAALAEGPAEALESSLLRLRVSDSVDPATAVTWCSAESLAGWPRTHVRLLGLSARSWPRRSSDDDPLLPKRVLGEHVLHEQSTARRDSQTLTTLLAQTSEHVTLSRPRRGGDGRKLSPSPLLRGLTGAAELERLPKRGTVHALSEADRRSSRQDELATDPAMRRAVAAFAAARDPNLTAHDGLVRPNHPVVLRAVARPLSATSLKRLLLNPQGFVASYGLGWTEPQPESEALQLDAARRGSLLHEILEACNARIEERGGFGALATSELESLAQDSAEATRIRWELQGPVPPPLAWQAELERAVRTAVGMLSVTWTGFEGGRSYAEVRFGFDRAHEQQDARGPWSATAQVVLPGTDLRLRGVIDRLDVDEAGTRVRVIDYKSGNPRKHEGNLDQGNELQRALYAMAVKQLLGEEYDVEAGLLYAGASEPDFVPDAEAGALQLGQAAQEALSLLADGKVFVGPAVTSLYEETLLALPSFGAGYYYAVKGAALTRERERLDALLLEPSGPLSEVRE